MENTHSNIGLLDPAKYLTLRDVLEKGLEFESKAVENYHNIAKKALEVSDYVTYRLATTILADELKDEQHTKDVLKNLEVADNKYPYHLKDMGMFSRIFDSVLHGRPPLRMWPLFIISEEILMMLYILNYEY